MPRSPDQFIPDLDPDAVMVENARLVQLGLAVWKTGQPGDILLVRSGQMEEWQKIVLNGIRQWGTIGKACNIAKIARAKVIRYMRYDPVFAQDMEQARQEFVDKLEGVAFSRALSGSEPMLKFTLTGLRAETYSRPTQLEAQIKSTSDITSRSEVSYNNDQLSDIIEILSQSGALPSTGADRLTEEDPDTTTH